MYWRAPRLALVATWVIQSSQNKYVYILFLFEIPHLSDQADVWLLLQVIVDDSPAAMGLYVQKNTLKLAICSN